MRSVAAGTGAVLDGSRCVAWQGRPDLEALMDDDVHPNALGHELLAQTLLTAVDAVARWNERLGHRLRG